MSTLESRIYDANRAREVLDNEAFNAAFADIEQEVFDRWQNSPSSETAARERLWIYQFLLKELKKNLTTRLETGKLAELDLKHKQTLADRARNILNPYA